MQTGDEFWGCNAQHSDYSQQYYIINFKVAKRLDLICSHHTHKKMVIMWCDGGIS